MLFVMYSIADSNVTARLIIQLERSKGEVLQVLFDTVPVLERLFHKQYCGFGLRVCAICF